MTKTSAPRRAFPSRRRPPCSGYGRVRGLLTHGARVRLEPEALLYQTVARAGDLGDVVIVAVIERLQRVLAERDAEAVQDAEPRERRDVRHRVDRDVLRGRNVQERRAHAAQRIAERVARDA